MAETPILPRLEHKKLKISVVIPTYNRAELIERAVSSVLTQSYDPYEVIVVDDGSTDGTREILKNYETDVHLISQENQGVSSARNAGINYATGDWIALLDSDDEWVEEKLAKQVDAISQRPSFEVCHTDEIWIRNGRRVNAMKKHAKPTGWIFPQCLPLCCVSPSSVLIKKDVFDRVGLFDEALPACEDYDLWLRIFCLYPVLLLPEYLIKKYGGHDDQLSRKYWGMDRFRVDALVKILASGVLGEKETVLAQDMLVKKLTILISGFEKREKTQETKGYRRLLEKWSTPTPADSH